MSPGDRAVLGRREPVRPQYGATAPGPTSYYTNYGVPHPSAWLGAPLVSVAGRVPQARQTSLSKLAMHAQGAPLIIQNRFDRRKFTAPPPEQRIIRTESRRYDVPEGNRQRNQQQQIRTRVGRNINTDAVSVASDESSGSNNSDTMLPRIIKPRKRRKKDRKPNNIVTHDLSAVNLDLVGVDCNVSNSKEVSSIYEDNYLYRHVNSHGYPDSSSENYGISALGEALEATRFGFAEAASPVESATSSCQCRYCDPLSQIWDANSMNDILNEKSTVDFLPTKLEDSMKVVGSIGRRGVDTTLRRSWSDPASRIPERIDTTRESISSPNLYSLFPPTRRSSSPQSPLALEISSEIVTSINGHRDIEIKLFSTSPIATENKDRRSFFADSSESVSNDDTVVKCNQKVNSATNSVQSKTISDREKNIHKSEDFTEVATSTSFPTAIGESPHKCDLALVSV